MFIVKHLGSCAAAESGLAEFYMCRRGFRDNPLFAGINGRLRDFCRFYDVLIEIAVLFLNNQYQKPAKYDAQSDSQKRLQ